jgi:hypothetical protein
MRKLYYLVSGSKGLELTEGDPGLSIHAQTYFHLEQPAISKGEDPHRRKEFDQMLDAALRAEILSGHEVHWRFNSVWLNTGMKHTNDLWAKYTELNAEMGS